MVGEVLDIFGYLWGYLRIHLKVRRKKYNVFVPFDLFCCVGILHVNVSRVPLLTPWDPPLVLP